MWSVMVQGVLCHFGEILGVAGWMDEGLWVYISWSWVCGIV